MIKSLIRLFSFFAKEVNEVRRQPRLVLSLLLGPFLVLLIFGAGYRGGQPTLRTAIVMPASAVEDIAIEELAELAGANFQLISVSSDLEQAMSQLQAGELDVVQIFPDDMEERVLRGEQAEVEIRYNEINPLNEQWIQYLSYAEVVEINRSILINNAGALQGEAQDMQGQLADVREQLTAIEQGLGSTDEQELQGSIRRLKTASGALALSALVARPESGVDGEQTREELLQLQEDLDALDQAIAQGDLERQRERVSSTRERIERLEGLTATMSELPPAVIVSPLIQTYQNLNGASYDIMVYYAPSVLAMLVQHIAVTLGALSLVRERLLGAVEMFQVAPIQLWHVLLGKYMGFTLFISIIVAMLTGLMVLLGVPLLGPPLIFAGLVLLLTLAALGVGFLLSALSSSESQAVQLSMLSLLLSVFFSGFFLPLQNFAEPARWVGYALPITHGINGLLDLMLRGAEPRWTVWAALGIITAVTFIGALLLEARQYYRSV